MKAKTLSNPNPEAEPKLKEENHISTRSLKPLRAAQLIGIFKGVCGVCFALSFFDSSKEPYIHIGLYF